ncbi:unnamed protein product [Rotaria sordida]|uniref:histone acetyltransferase n=3 Tax=Rotaria sordida TaxID=392033 RepID=A0A819TWC1_9BILA|nr:unnamed protein product [Rotaria sordida]CAF4086214.1 unnamed protein product [Rotaria sordida]
MWHVKIEKQIEGAIIYALHLDQIWSEGFICNTCICQNNIECKENPYITQRLTVIDLSSRLEQRVNKFLLHKDCHDEGHVTNRVLASKIEVVAVIFFGMYVQEYDEYCPASNTRRVYISYLDNVKQHGYTYGHIWARPASEDVDYIFHCHLPEQHLPKSKIGNIIFVADSISVFVTDRVICSLHRAK